ncbi:MAG: hypothetical protein DRH97_00790 [Chloroflexi bacterium]|nr:MAG: hypothetical protein DRH97_00790 [Chloroflexota bacterium]
MKILEFGNELSCANVCFQYKGYEISMSTGDRQTIVFASRESSNALFTTSASLRGLDEAREFVDNIKQ